MSEEVIKKSLVQQTLDSQRDSADEQSRLAAKTADGFDNFVSKLGLNNRNTLSAGHYEFNLMTRNRIQLEAAYRGSWIVGKIVDSIPEDMTRSGISITTDSNDDVKKIRSAISRLQISQAICTNEKWARLYGGSIAVIQIEGQKLDTPLDVSTIGKGQFRGLVVYDRWQLNPVLQDVIDSGPELGLPKYYEIVNDPRQVQATAPTMTGQIKVHHSRCVRSIGIMLPYFQAITEMMWGESNLERLWDRLISYDNASMSAASLIDRANLRMVGVQGLRDIIGAGGEALQGLVSMFEMVRSMQVNEGITLLDKDDSYEANSYSFAGLSDMLIQFGQQLSGACDTPLVILFGQSPAGMNATGESDIRNYYDKILANQEAKLRNPWEVVLKVLWRSVLGKDCPEDMEFEFVPLWQMSETDKATNAKTTAETVIGAYEAGMISRSVGMQELKDKSPETGLFSNIPDEDIAEAAEEDPPVPEAVPAAPTPGEKPVTPVPGLDSRSLLDKLLGRKK